MGDGNGLTRGIPCQFVLYNPHKLASWDGILRSFARHFKRHSLATFKKLQVFRDGGLMQGVTKT